MHKTGYIYICQYMYMFLIKSIKKKLKSELLSIGGENEVHAVRNLTILIAFIYFTFIVFLYTFHPFKFLDLHDTGIKCLHCLSIKD